jgi:hypothetical protein
MQTRPKYDALSMKPALVLVYIFLCCSGMHAQTTGSTPQQTATPNSPQASPSYLPVQNPTAPQGPVAISDEPHHRLVLQNDFVRVYNVMVPALDFTLVHKHDLPYLYVVLGMADIINAITGKPELHQVLQDGETHYSPGHFTHLVRTDSGVPFHNVTVELVHPQGTPKNLCKEVLAGAPLDCAEKKVAVETKSRAARDQMERESTPNDIPYFETDEILVDLHKASGGNDYIDAAPKFDALLVALTNANLDANLAGEHIQFLHGGDVMWLPAGQRRRVVDFLGTHSSFLLITFKDSAPVPAAQ